MNSTSTTNLNQTTTIKERFKLKDPGSAITHFIAALMAIIAAGPLLTKAAVSGFHKEYVSCLIFIVSMILLYSASTTYHSLDLSEKVNLNLKKFDHASIFLLIAGSYTPVCIIALHNRLGTILLAVIWTIAIAGICFKLFWVTCPKWLSSIMYISMGWLCVIAFAPLTKNLCLPAFLWLLIGGIIYTIGGVIYALKLPLFNAAHKNFGTHEIFHLFCIGGSACHYIMVYCYMA